MRAYFAGLGIALALGAQAQESTAPLPITAVPVVPGLTMLMGKGGNVAVLTGTDGPVLVDDQYAEQVPGIREAVKRLQDAPVRFVVNTHYHGDHTGGNAAFGGDGAVLIAHDAVFARLSTDQFSKLFDRTTPAAPRAAWPVVTFARDVNLRWNGETLTAEHVANAHTDGDSVVWFAKADAVHCGDTFFNGMYPFVDVEAGGSFAGMIAANDTVLAGLRPSTKVLPGHGPLATAAELRKFRDMLATVKARVEAAIAAGKTLAAFQAEKPLADLDPAWGGGFLKADQVLSLAWMDLSRKK
jgi:glyoxylase-like metal-dependent hydrolase (beta-lactamase superfamily II)